MLSGIFCVKGDMKDGIKFFEGDNFQEIKLFTGSVLIFPSNVKYGMTSQLGDESILIHFTLK